MNATFLVLKTNNHVFSTDAPFQNSSNRCIISSMDNLECAVVFYSNPNATFVSVVDADSGEIKK